MNFQELIQRAFIPPEAYNHIAQLQELIATSPKQYEYMVDTPLKLQENFQESYRAKADAYAKTALLMDQHCPKSMLTHMHFVFENSTFYLNWNAFISTIRMLGTPEQYSEWEKLTFDHRILGAYAQTEVGHGSNVQGLETTATLGADEFIINSPTASSYKYWPGLMGIYGTHVVAQAQTYVGGKDIGVQTFVIPIRDPLTYKPLPGIDVGDMGPKLGFLRADNGYVAFNNVRIPRKNMLMKYTEVTRNGEVKVQSKQAVKFGYGSMLYLRVNLVFTFALMGTIQNNLAFNQLQIRLSEDPRSLSNQNTMFKLLRSYVVNYSMILANCAINKLFTKYNQQLEQQSGNIGETLQMVHLYSSQLKSISGWEAIKTSREAIQLAPFGHLNASSIITSYSDNVPFATYEGDNNVLLQQSAQFIMKQFQRLSQHKPAIGICEYFNAQVSLQYVPLEQLDDSTELLGTLERFAYQFSKHTISEFQECLMKGQVTLNSAWNELYQVDLIKMATIFSYVNVYRQMKQEINQQIGHVSRNTLVLLERISRLYAAFILLEFRPIMVGLGVVNIGQIKILQYIDHIAGDKLNLLEELSTGLSMMRARYLMNIDWNNLNMKPKL